MNQSGNSPGDDHGQPPVRHVEVEVISPGEYRGKKKARPFAATSQTEAQWAYSANAAGCLPAAVTCALFLVCIAQYGVLAAIGFAVFHLAGNVMAAWRQARQLILGRQFNIWLWRTGNWLVSYLLTAWLATAR